MRRKYHMWAVGRGVGGSGRGTVRPELALAQPRHSPPCVGCCRPPPPAPKPPHSLLLSPKHYQQFFLENVWWNRKCYTNSGKAVSCVNNFYPQKQKYKSYFKNAFHRQEICQKIYKTRFWVQKFYTLKARKLPQFLLPKKLHCFLAKYILICRTQRLKQISPLALQSRQALLNLQAEAVFSFSELR